MIRTELSQDITNMITVVHRLQNIMDSALIVSWSHNGVGICTQITNRWL